MYQLTDNQIATLTALRHELHERPEISGEEAQTAERISRELRALGADRIWRGVGGHGVAAQFTGLKEEGPTVLLRCELDGLPIREISNLAYRSALAGKGHLCGHDGHMASLIGVAMGLANRPATGRVILLFQPAEETGAGAQAVIEDAQWAEIRPDYAFAYHNVPGRPLGEIGWRTGPSNCASRGMKIKLEGKSSHAAAPEDGVSPGPAMSALMAKLPKLSHGTVGDDDFALVTLTHAILGEAAFGIAPADGEVWTTLRSMTNVQMDRLMVDAQEIIEQCTDGLNVQITWHDVFLSVANHVQATELAQDVANKQGRQTVEIATPFRWSEDFGRFGDEGIKTSLLYIGAGENHPQLHNPDYDFPDALIPVASELFIGIVAQILGRAEGQ
ncbi:amidohydrolase [Maritalea porphyrae]|mgnify:CR=1 FL=1|jgi:amidohydrolase|uniref:amidohydrolase n=2 Tax=Maritalea TaxID=623276 RepID=UPI0022B01FBF|nr:amidohydrolase [Maritalea porphyrae]MCZ4271841.1 amidohydrolase [Maritalea porphyrae]